MFSYIYLQVCARYWFDFCGVSAVSEVLSAMAEDFLDSSPSRFTINNCENNTKNVINNKKII